MLAARTGQGFQAAFDIRIGSHIDHIAERADFKARRGRAGNVAGALAASADGAEADARIRAEDAAGNDLEIPGGGGGRCGGTLDHFTTGYRFHGSQLS